MEDVSASKDGLVRSCIVGYRIPKASDKPDQYTGGTWISLTRSIQRLSLILPVEEQDESVVIDNNKIKPGKIETSTVNEKKKKRPKEKWVFTK